MSNRHGRARCARRPGAGWLVYRRAKRLPARLEEIHAKGHRFVPGGPLKLEGDENGWVRSVHCQQMELSEPDASGRARPVPVEGAEFDIPADCVIIAIGNTPNPLISATTEGLETNRWGCLVLTDEDAGLTTRERVYAGGDVVTGAATVILAMGAGKTAAAAIAKQLS